MNVLVTGGAGFVGSALTRRLVGEGFNVAVLDNFSRGRKERFEVEDLFTQILIFDVDIRDRSAVASAVQWADLIWHLAYVQGTQVFTEKPRLTIDVALNGIMAVLDGCEVADESKELILVSSSEAYNIPPKGMVPTPETVPLSVPDPRNPRFAYGGGKIASEIAVMAYAHDHILKRGVIVRPHNIYGPDAGYEHVIPQLARRVVGLAQGEDLTIQGTGQETRSLNYITDAVDGLMLVQKHAQTGQIYHLGTMEEVSIKRLAEMILAYYGREGRKVVPSELPEGSPPRRQPDISKLKEFGYKPKVSLTQGLKETLEWYAEHPQ